MTLERLQALLEGLPAFRVRQAAHAVFQEGRPSFAEVSTLPAELRKKLAATPLLSFEADDVRVSADRRAHKAAVRLRDGLRVETVLMEPKPGHWTACISSQVGCALGCTFCATGLMGFSRNLTAEEISDQVLFWRQVARKERAGPPSNVVYMGMGEPFLNIEAVFESLETLTDPAQFGLGQRHVSVSTAGIAPGIERFAEAFPQVNLALSLHAASAELRTRLVPVNKAYGLDRLKKALAAYFARNRRKVFVEYVLLSGENDRPEDADALAAFLKEAGPPGLLHVNLIVFNPTQTPHRASRPDDARRFAERLESAGLPVTFRKNLGQDIEGACGQLVLQEPRPSAARRS